MKEKAWFVFRPRIVADLSPKNPGGKWLEYRIVKTICLNRIDYENFATDRIKVIRFLLDVKTARQGSVVLPPPGHCGFCVKMCKGRIILSVSVYSSSPICSMKTRNPNPLPTGFKFGFLQYGRVEQKRCQLSALPLEAYHP